MKEVKELPAVYRLGIDTVDKQHAQIINCLEESLTLKALSAGERELRMNDLISELKNYAKNHFSFEEKLMKEIDFNEGGKHKLLHEEFMKKVAYLQTCGPKYPDEIVQDTSVFLKTWFLNHINKQDRNYVASYLMSQQVVDYKK